ncbi:hypothetical protein KUV89_03680 [Marinobacter hydrocarbonoclasticus]|nr:hypothetical protein [Marinobacter nauticus]
MAEIHAGQPHTLMRKFVARLRRTWRYAIRNAQFLAGRPHLHIAIFEDCPWSMPFFDWIERTHPAVYRHIRLTYATGPFTYRWPGGRGLLPWVPSPSTHQDHLPYEELLALEQIYLQHDLPVFNPISRLSHARQAIALATAQEMGLHCADYEICGPESRIEEIQALVGSPFLVRDLSEFGRPAYTIFSEAQWRTLPWHLLRQPVAYSWQDGDDLPYFALASGERLTALSRGGDGIPPTLPVDSLPLIRLQETLGLTLLAYEMSTDRQGAPVLWGVAPLPKMLEQQHELDQAALETVYQATLYALLDKLGWHYSGVSVQTSAASDRSAKALNRETE